MTEPTREPPGRVPDGARASALARSRSLTFVTLLAGGLLGVVASAQPWWRAAGAGTRVAFKGTEATGGLSQALAVVVLAGALLVLVLRVRGRRVVAGLLAVVAAGVVLVGALRLRPTADAVRTKVREVSLIDQYALSSTAWPYVYALAGLGMLLGAVLLWLGAPQWTVRPDRFDRIGTEVGVSAENDPAGVWTALDAGFDPTADPSDADTPSRLDPDVRIEGTGDTMEPIDPSGPSTPTGRSSQLPE